MREVKKIYEVDVVRFEEDGETWWGADGGLEGESVGIDFYSTTDLHELVEEINEELFRHRDRWPNLAVKWTLNSGPANELFDFAENAGIQLPR